MMDSAGTSISAYSSSLRIVARLAAWLLISLAILSMVVSVQGRYKIAVNRTSSLEGKLFLVDAASGVTGSGLRGEVVAFNFDGRRWGFPEGVLWAKQVAGLPGDPIEVKEGEVWVANRKVAVLSSGAMERGSLNPVGARRVPEGRIFVVGTATNSLDSRYLEFGFPRMDDLVGTARRLL